MEVGFVGLGEMGRPMAANLLKAGHTVRAWNRSPGPLQALASEGAQPLSNVREAFSGSVVMSMLADDAAVRSALITSGALDAAPPGLVHVNLATISVALALELAEAHRARGLHYVAAPVFGRPDAAAAAALTVLAAGEAAAVERVRPLLEAISQKVWFLGDGVERANVVKIAGNFMLAAAIERMGEAAALVRGYGVETGELLEVMTSGLFNAPAYKNYGAIIAEERFEPAGFRLRLGLKDVRLALGAGDARNVPLAFASVLRDALLEAVALGDGDKDWSALALVAARRASIDSRT
jgi:3-hydroxyisobutyrate dehydrogenase-like beta-hydroxyacid dehydrogenase